MSQSDMFDSRKVLRSSDMVHGESSIQLASLSCKIFEDWRIELER